MCRSSISTYEQTTALRMGSSPLRVPRFGLSANGLPVRNRHSGGDASCLAAAVLWGGSIGAPPKCGKAATRLGCAWAERRLACGGGVSLCTDFAFAERRVSIAMKGLEPALGEDVAGVVRDDDIGPCTGKGVHIFHDNGAFIDQARCDGGFDHAVLARYIVASDRKQ